MILELEKFNISTHQRIEFIFIVIIFKIQKILINISSLVNYKLIKCKFKIFIYKIKKYVSLFINNLVDSYKKNFAMCQTIIMLFIFFNILLTICFENKFSESFIFLFNSTFITVMASILFIITFKDNFIRKIDRSLLNILFLEIFYLPFYLTKYFLDIMDLSISESYSFFFEMTQIFFGTIALIIAPKVVLSSIGQKGFKMFNMPISIPSLFQSTPQGISSHIEYIENSISNLYDEITFWDIEYFSISNNDENDVGTFIVSYPSKFRKGRTYPITICINGIKNIAEPLNLIIDVPDFEESSFLNEINDDNISYFLLNPKNLGQTKLTLRLFTSNGEEICGVNLMSSIRGDINEHYRYFIGISMMFLYVFEIIFGINILKV